MWLAFSVTERHTELGILRSGRRNRGRSRRSQEEKSCQTGRGREVDPYISRAREGLCVCWKQIHRKAGFMSPLAYGSYQNSAKPICWKVRQEKSLRRWADTPHLFPTLISPWKECLQIAASEHFPSRCPPASPACTPPKLLSLLLPLLMPGDRLSQEGIYFALLLSFVLPPK